MLYDFHHDLPSAFNNSIIPFIGSPKVGYPQLFFQNVANFVNYERKLDWFIYI